MRRSALAAVLIVVLCATRGSLSSFAAEAYSEDAVKAAFLYRFAGYVDWPQDIAMRAPQAPFTIAVLGDDGVVRELQNLLPSHAIKNRPAEVHQIRRIQDLGDAQMLYIAPRHRGDLHSLLGALAMKPVLVVTDEEGGLDEGSTVNFLLLDRRVRFEVSLAAAERSGLKISSELLSVAARVQGGRLRSDASCVLSGTTDAPGETASPRQSSCVRLFG